ncbi:ABC transporter permease [Wenjunlia vitaminophila]|uniref:ABC transporter permease n=1 Tax=Wenjunlia vitaminophila TaxID=76728 RepID=UPI00035E017D|nr:ABC transporter permease [Wenjunlia vitaminophila]
MAQTTLLTTTDPEPAPDVPVKPGRFAGLRHALAPIRQARGVPKALLLTGLAISTIFVLAAVFAPLIAPYDFDQYQADGERFPKQGSPGGDHLFGTTVQSLDVLSRVVYGARTALEVMLLAVFFSLIIGVLLGLLSGYFGGWLDRILVLIMDALFAFPYLLLAIVAGFIFSGVAGGSVVTAALAITVVYIPQYFRVVRSSALSAREATYVEAARAMGAKPGTVIRKYLFSNVVQSVPVITTMNAADAISTLAGLGFLGMGIEPTDAAEWGYDLERAIDDVGAGMWWTALYPGLAILLAILGFTLLGEGLNDVLNPTTRRRRISKVVIPGATARRTVLAATTPAATATAAAGSEDPTPDADDAPGTATEQPSATAGTTRPDLVKSAGAAEPVADTLVDLPAQDASGADGTVAGADAGTEPVEAGGDTGDTGATGSGDGAGSDGEATTPATASPAASQDQDGQDGPDTPGSTVTDAPKEG